MTVIGHLATAGVVAGTTGLIPTRTTFRLIAYYVLVMAFFVLWIHHADPKQAAALYIDWTGNIAGLYFVWKFWRGTTGQRFFVAMLVGSQLLGGFSHPFDLLVLKINGAVPVGKWEPQNFWHTPLFALAYCLLASPLVWMALKIPYRRALGGLVFGYALHISMDTITYNFPIYWLWPFSGWGWAFAQAWIPETTGTATTFGAVLYRFRDTDYNPHWGWVIYQTEPLINVLLSFLFAAQQTMRHWGLALPVENRTPPVEIPTVSDVLNDAS